MIKTDKDLHMHICSILNEDDVVLDIGCGNKFHASKLKEENRCKKIITLDAWENTKPDILLDVSKESLPFSDESVDVVLMIDLIEHLEKDEGERLLVEAERVCKKCLVILTPLWWDDNKKHVEDPRLWCYGNQFNLHKSLWTEEDFHNWTRWHIPDHDDYFIGVKHK